MGRVYRAIREGFWNGPDPLPRNRSLLRDANGRFPQGRWNEPSQDALYTSYQADVAFTEAAGRLAPGTNARMFLEAQGAWPVRLVVARFEEPASTGLAFDGRDKDETYWIPFMRPLPPNDHAFATYRPSQRSAAAWLIAGANRLIVPSSPYFNRRPREIAWNSVFMIGGWGQFAQADLPSKRALREVFRQDAR